MRDKSETAKKKTPESTVKTAEKKDIKSKDEKKTGKKKNISEKGLKSLYQNAIRLFKENKPRKALTEFAKIQKQQPNYKETGLYRAECYILLTQITEAEKIVEEIIKENGSAQAFTIRAICKEKKKEFDSAIEDYETALGYKADYSRALIRLARITSEYQNQHVKAIELFSKAKDKARAIGVLRKIRKNFFEEIMQVTPEERVQRLKKMIRVDGDHVRYHIRMIQNLWGQKNRKFRPALDQLEAFPDSKIRDLEDKRFVSQILLTGFYKTKQYEKLRKHAIKRFRFNGEVRNFHVVRSRNPHFSEIMALGIVYHQKAQKEKDKKRKKLFIKAYRSYLYIVQKYFKERQRKKTKFDFWFAILYRAFEKIYKEPKKRSVRRWIKFREEKARGGPRYALAIRFPKER